MTAEFRHAMVDVDGLRLHCAVAGDAGRPLMLFLHGFPEFWAAWRTPMAYFAARGWLCVAPDLRGYNLSDKPEGVDAYKAKHLVSDVLAVAAHYSKSKFVLVAHDWGGALAWAVAIGESQRPESRISRLVMINSPHPYLFWRELSDNPAQQKASEYMNVFRLPKAERVLSENGYARLLASFMHLGAAWRAELVAAWSQPGAKKLQFKPEDFMVRAPDASHWIVHEKPDLVCGEIEKFLGEAHG